MDSFLTRLSAEELEGETGAVLPDKEVLSVPLLDLNADIDLALALAAPIDLAVAANANVALPIDAAVSANVLSAASESAALAKQGVMIDQFVSGEAIAHGEQTSVIEQGDGGATDGATGATVDAIAATGATEPAAVVEGAAPAATVEPTTEATQPTAETSAPATDAASAPTGETQAVTAATEPAAVTDPVTELVETPTDLSTALDGGLLNVDINLALDADIAAPIAGAVAANANIAAPIDAAVAANIASIGSNATAVADQTAIITQTLEDVTAEATVEQDAEIGQ